MANLNSWQRIDRVLVGQPFGDGRDGAYTSGTIPTLQVKSCSGTATSTTLTADTDASPYAVGDVILLHQTRGTGAGQWEINQITAVGSDQYTLKVALNYTYTDSGASQAQVIKIPMYSNVNVSSGTWTLSDWAGDTGGILPVACNSTFTHAGTIAGTGKGFRGGAGRNDGGQPATQGESEVNTGTTSTAANGSGGGGGNSGGSGQNQGGGGGHSSTGENAGANGGAGGSTIGTADLTSIFFGGAGGGGRANGGETGTAGGDSGGIFMLFSRIVSSVSGVAMNGANSADGTGGADGGGGAGGSVLICCESGSLGSTTITATKGSNTDLNAEGSAGRIAIHHSGTVTGTTSPTFEDVSDASMVENVGGYFYTSM